MALAVGLVSAVLSPMVALCDLIEDKDLQAHELARYWQVQLPLLPAEQVRAIYPVQENLYCVTNRGTLFAVHRRVGIVRWSLELDGPSHPVFAPSHLPDTESGQGPALVTTAKQLRLVDRRTGEVLAQHRLRFVASGPAVSDGHRIYLGGLDRRVHCLRLPDFFRQWRITISSPVTTRPLLSEGMLYFITSKGEVVSCTALDKKLQWRTNLGMAVGAQPVLDEKAGLLVPGLGRALFALDAGGASVPTWRFRCNGPVSAGPWVTPEAIYFVSEEEGVFSLNSSGAKKWVCPEAVAFGAEIGGLSFLLDSDGDLAALDSAKGSRRYTLPMTGVELVVASPDDPALVVASSEGRLLCVRHRDAPYLRAEEVEAALKGPVPEPRADVEPKPEAKQNVAVQEPPRIPSQSKSKIDPLGVSRPKP